MTLRPAAALLFASLLLAPAAALACAGDCDHDRHAVKKDAAKPAAAAQPADADKPAGEVTAKCNCSGPSDCTCKKGECKCKKCSKDHKHHGSLVPRLKGAKGSSELPASARIDASSGLFI